MTAVWMMYVLLVGTLLACAALAADVALRRTGMPTRWVWALALAGSIALAALAPRGQSQDALVLPAAKTAAAAPMVFVNSTAPSYMAAVQSAGRAVEGAITRGIAFVELRIPEGTSVPLGIAWCVLSAGILALLIVVNRRVDRARLAWPVTELHGSVVRVAPAVGPAVVGLAHPEIIVPEWLFERSSEEQRLVVVHEREHVAAHDQFVLIGAWCAAALLPWHPAVWWMLSRLRLAIELDCDARVLHRGVPARPYGALLIDIAGQCSGLRIGALPLADTPTHLERRLLAMRPTRARYLAVRMAVLGSVAALSVLVACEARMPTSSEIASMDAASARTSAVKAKLLDEQAKPVYLVDGVVVSAEEAMSISAARIASIDVSKPKGDERGQLSIITVDGKTEPNKLLAEKRALGAMSPAGREGRLMVHITNPKGAAEADTMPLRRVRMRGAGDSVVIGYALQKKAAAVGMEQPLFVIDGVVSTKEQMSALKAKDIDTVDVIKGASAVQEWPEPAAINGVVKIVTKKGVAP